MQQQRPPPETTSEKAITKRSDGVVLINQELCTGCMACFEACPFGVIQLNPEKQAVEMCNLCVHRIDAGLEPACVHYCQTNCMYFGNINDIVKVIQDKEA